MLNKFVFGLTIACATAIPQAQPAGGYAQDGNGAIMRSGEGLCWRSGFWTPEDAATGCDGALVPPISKPIAPAIVAAPAATAPPVSSVAAAKCDFTITLQDKLFFEFGKATLSSTAKSQIDNEVLAKLNPCAGVDSILITGHTDRLGAVGYNEKLSMQRAASVASYLRTQGIATPLKTHGAGATQPVTTCGNQLGQKQLVECLAPNRRVVITVNGATK